MEKHFLDKTYTETLESVIAEKMLKENEIEEFLNEQFTVEKIQKYYKEAINKFPEDENALGLALTVEKLYDKAELAGVSRVKEKISDLKNITNRLNELDTESNM